ncbi:MAG: hypothetical protein KDD48_07895 [Bdellovibrionales bacterium]|nr:hypothetical protein [Bdellovibrionales bacterium]
MKNIVKLLCLVCLSTVAHASTISGKIVFNGKVPPPSKIKMSADPNCSSSGIAFDEQIVSTDGGLGNTFVYIKDYTGSASKATTPVILDQKGCVYKPRVVGVQVGQPVTIVNSDPTLHNVHGVGKSNAQFNLGMPIQNMKITKTFDKAELGMRLKCDVHPWMNTWVNVVTHPYFSISSSNGKYEIKDAPAGKYKVGIWHETLGEQELSITVPSTGSVNLDFKVASK